MTNGKGDKYRPVDRRKYAVNYDRIFGKRFKEARELLDKVPDHSKCEWYKLFDKITTDELLKEFVDNIKSELEGKL